MSNLGKSNKISNLPAGKFFKLGENDRVLSLIV